MSNLKDFFAKNTYKGKEWPKEDFKSIFDKTKERISQSKKWNSFSKQTGTVSLMLHKVKTSADLMWMD